MSYSLAHAHIIYARVGEESSQGCVSLLVGAGLRGGRVKGGEGGWQEVGTSPKHQSHRISI